MGQRSFFAELKRRNVLRAATLYAAGAWLMVQVVTQVGPVFDLPSQTQRWIIVAAAIGFPIAMALSWFYELTPDGFKREGEVEVSETVRYSTGRKLDFAIIGVLSLAVVLLLANQFVARKEAIARPGMVASIIDKSIAVLPLANEGGDKDEQYFSDGLSEDLITALSQFDGLKVINRNSSFQFRDSKDDSAIIGRKLGVAHLLEGSVRRVGDAVRISAELVNAADGRTLWSQKYDRPYKDLFKLQDDITVAVAGALKTRLLAAPGAVAQSDRPPSGNLDAYNAYLQGVFHTRLSTPEGIAEAIRRYAKAVEIDPRYAFAEAQLATNAALLGSAFLEGEAAQRSYAQARTAANNALALDPKLAAAHVARGNVLAFADLNWVDAQSEFRLAVQLAPNDGQAAFSLGTMTATLGNPAEAIALTRRAIATDPRNTSWIYWLSVYLQAVGRLDEAKRTIRSAIEMQPEAVVPNAQLAIIEVQHGDFAQAMKAARVEPPGMWQDDAVAMALQIGPDRAAADAALKTVIDRDSGALAYQIAELYALRHDPDQVFAWLDRAWTNHDTGVHRLLYDPFLAPYRTDPRFAAFCRKVGLPIPNGAGAAASTPSDAAKDASGVSGATP